MSKTSWPPLVTITALTLGCAALLWITQRATGPQIDAQRAAALRSSLIDLAGSSPLQSLGRNAAWPLRLCDAVTLVRIEPRGYGGAITLAVALVPSAQGPKIRNLQTVRHQETPGIGDFIAERDSNAWLARFRGSSNSALSNRPLSVDAVSGATVTVQAVRKGLQTLMEQVAADTELFNTAACEPTAEPWGQPQP